MDDEIKSIYKNDVWQLTNLPPNQHVIMTKWIYYTQTETHANGTPTKLKAKLVTKGFQQW
jgi:hypothetical protein